MKISLEWLSQYLPGPLSAETAADALTHGGLPVEDVEKIVRDGKSGETTDTVIDVEVTSNRSDCLSHVGVARELAALLDREFRDVAITDPPAGPAAGAQSDGLSALAIEAQDLCPHYTARVIRGVTVGPSPAWLQRRLTAIGLRPVNNVVDVTNYVLMEMGQPLHAFDLDRMHGRRVTVRPAVAGERLTTLDGRDHPLTPDMLVIADADRPVALAGVMGGRDTEVTDRTVNVLLESARFDPLSVRSTARKLSMGSDSSYRFERGIDPTLPERASRRATALIVETAGGRPDGPLMAAGDAGYSPRSLWLRLTRLKQVLGVEFPDHQVVDALARLGLRPQLRGERVDVTVPSHRLDLTQEIDLVEEAARVIGYQHIPEREQILIRVAPPDPVRAATDAIRSSLIAGGYCEALTFTFVADRLATAFLPPDAAGLPRADGRTRKVDAQLRPSLLPGLLEAVHRNQTVGTPGVRLFEIGSTFWLDGAGTVVERRRVGLVGGTDYRAARGAVEAVLARLDADRPITVTPAERPGYTAGGCGEVRWGGAPVGFVGKVDRSVADAIGLRDVPMAAELDLAALLDGARHVPQLRPLPRFPAVRRDLSLVLPEQTRYEQVDATIRAVAPADLEAVEYVTTYRGKPLDSGTKSVTVALVFRSPTATLTGDAVESAVAGVVNAARVQLGATLRA
jgi:phenylalanyl-tRNA synthetase beta chain